jgi:hypothetical protein
VAQAWMLSDHVLYRVLTAWLTALPTGVVWFMDLFQNDYDPQPGDTLAEYQIGDWEGYESYPMPVNGWQQVQVVNHEAQSEYAETALFSVDYDEDDQLVYGYLIRDALNTLILAESFSQSYTIPTNGSFQVQAYLRLDILPVPDMLLKKFRPVRFEPSRTRAPKGTGPRK